MNDNQSLAEVLEFLKGDDLQEFMAMFVQQHSRTEDLYALSLMQPLLARQYLPFNRFALRPVCLIHILNDIVINNRKSIIEFGSGISTIMIGRLIQANNLHAKLVSVEHSREWVEVMEKTVQNEGLEAFVTLVHAPLTACSFAVNGNQWYDTEVINSKIGNTALDMVIVDGPPAYEASKQEARYPALPFAFNKLPGAFAIYLDDINRDGEQSVLRKWEREFSLKFSITGASMAYATRGDNFNADVLRT